MTQAEQRSTFDNDIIVSQPSPLAQTNFLSNFQSLKQYNTQPYQFIGQKLFATILSVSISQILVNRTIVTKYMKDALFKNLKDQNTRNQSLSIHLKKLTKKMIQYNSIVFTTKVILDQYYSQTIQKNKQYYQSNQLIHYKIGAISGLTAYLLNLPLAQWQLIRSSMYHYDGKTMSKSYGWNGLVNDVKQFFKIYTVKNIINKFSIASLSGVVIYRTIYFGGYEKIKSRNQHPINQYLIAPVLSSLLGLLVSPLDYIKFLQLTSHKDKSFLEIINEKGYKIWNIPHQRVSVSVIRQASCMSFFVLGQKICKNLINYSHTSY